MTPTKSAVHTVLNIINAIVSLIGISAATGQPHKKNSDTLKKCRCQVKEAKWSQTRSN